MKTFLDNTTNVRSIRALNAYEILSEEEVKVLIAPRNSDLMGIGRDIEYPGLIN